jgi:HK97 family phage portal protein
LHPSAVLKHPRELGSKTYDALRESFKEKYSGLKNNQELMLIDEGMEIEFPTIKLVDAQFLEQAKLNEAQICGLFRVPLMLIQSTSNTTTFASAEQFMISYTRYGVTPDVVNYEKAIRRDLIPEEDREKYYAKFKIGALLRSSFKEQADSFAVLIDKEIINPNEARELMDLNPYAGGYEYRTRTSTTTGGNTDEIKL